MGYASQIIFYNSIDSHRPSYTFFNLTAKYLYFIFIRREILFNFAHHIKNAML